MNVLTLFCKRYKYQCPHFNWLKNCVLKHKFMIFNPVANLMHYPLGTCGHAIINKFPFVDDFCFVNCM